MLHILSDSLMIATRMEQDKLSDQLPEAPRREAARTGAPRDGRKSPDRNASRRFGARLGRWVRRRTTMRELEQLTDRDLKDIGLRRDEIPFYEDVVRR